MQTKPISASNSIKKRVRFPQKKEPNDFYSTLKKRVESYFIKNQKSRHANSKMHLKSALLVLTALGLYTLIISEIVNKPLLLLAAILLGIITGLIGINISHDAMHGSYTSSAKANRWLGYTYDLIGLSSSIWQITHNFNHHIYTNIPGMDYDIDKAIILRFSPKDKLYWFHYYQNWYGLLLYTFTTLNWTWFSDYLFLHRESKKRAISSQEIGIFFILKAINIFIFLMIPLMMMTFPWWQILIGYICLEMAGGFLVAIIFQLAHLVEQVQFLEPNENGEMGNSWAVHELMTTSNFCTKNPFLNYICGGLNFQIEHHLFPQICHIHYPDLSQIVKQTAEEFALPYYEIPTLMQAIKSHLNTLKSLGRPN